MIYIERQTKRGGFPTKKPKKASGFYKWRNPNSKHVQIEKRWHKYNNIWF